MPFITTPISIVLFILACCVVNAQPPAIDNAVALKYFHEAEAASRADDGKLWGKPLYGPMLFVDPGSRLVVTNQASPEGVLTRQGDVYVGKLPNTVGIANYSVNWAGVHWTMVMWGALSDDAYERRKLMMHESFHRIQSDVGFPASNPSNDHLDSLDGRYWLQLEWRSLRAALNSKGRKRRDSVEAALTFRAYRRSLFTGSEQSERQLEMNEGLAEYTGAIVASHGLSRTALIGHISDELDKAPMRPTFVRSFAYITGPAYGVLLDECAPTWRYTLKLQDDLAANLQHVLKISIAGDMKLDAEKLAKLYDGDALRKTEVARDDARKKTIAGYKARLVDGPTLTISLTNKNQYSFNPNNLIPMDASATVYPTAHVIDAWGILDITNGSLFYGQNGMVKSVVVAAPASLDLKHPEGDGWKLDLTDGWFIEPAQKQGCYELKKSPG